MFVRPLYPYIIYYAFLNTLNDATIIKLKQQKKSRVLLYFRIVSNPKAVIIIV